MLELKLKLTEIFKDNSLRNMQGTKNGPMAHSGAGMYSTYYITYGHGGDSDSSIKEILEKGNRWFYVGNQGSICSFIDLTDTATDIVSNRLIQYGPNSHSSSFHITCHEDGDIVRLIAQGWGSSSILLWKGDSKHFLQYLLDHQKRGDRLKDKVSAYANDELISAFGQLRRLEETRRNMGDEMSEMNKEEYALVIEELKKRGLYDDVN